MQKEGKVGGGLVGRVIVSAVYSVIGTFFVMVKVDRLDAFFSLSAVAVVTFLFGILGAFVVLSVVKFIRSRWGVITRSVFQFYLLTYFMYPVIGAGVGGVVGFIVYAAIFK